MKSHNLWLLLLTFMFSACATSPISPFQPPVTDQPHATVQTTMTDNGFFRLDTPTISIMTINGQQTDGRGEAWNLHPFSSFVIPLGNSFIEVKESWNGDFGYVHFNAKNEEYYTISYQQEPRHGYRFTVTDSQQHQVEARTFGGCDSTTTYGNENALLDAIAANDAKKVKLLLQEGANPNLLTYSGPNPIPLAALENNIEIIKLLIAAGACVNTLQGSYALIHAAKNGNLELAQVLLDNGANINLRSRVLISAVQNGQLKMVNFLLEYGVYTQFRNSEGKTALDLAKEAGYQEIVALLNQYKD